MLTKTQGSRSPGVNLIEMLEAGDQTALRPVGFEQLAYDSQGANATCLRGSV
jgi:hypothetical protein